MLEGEDSPASANKIAHLGSDCLLELASVVVTPADFSRTRPDWDGGRRSQMNYSEERGLEPTAPGKVAFSISEFATSVGVGRTFVFAEINAGRLRAVKAGARTLITADERARYVRSLPPVTPKS